MHTCIHTYIRTYIHTYVRTYMHTYIHTYICIWLYGCISNSCACSFDLIDPGWHATQYLWPMQGARWRAQLKSCLCLKICNVHTYIYISIYVYVHAQFDPVCIDTYILNDKYYKVCIQCVCIYIFMHVFTSMHLHISAYLYSEVSGHGLQTGELHITLIPTWLWFDWQKISAGYIMLHS